MFSANRWMVLFLNIEASNFDRPGPIKVLRPRLPRRFAGLVLHFGITVTYGREPQRHEDTKKAGANDYLMPALLNVPFSHFILRRR
jgi:hypothetical protein